MVLGTLRAPRTVFSPPPPPSIHPSLPSLSAEEAREEPREDTVGPSPSRRRLEAARPPTAAPQGQASVCWQSGQQKHTTAKGGVLVSPPASVWPLALASGAPPIAAAAPRGTKHCLREEKNRWEHTARKQHSTHSTTHTHTQHTHARTTHTAQAHTSHTDI